jgi:predicted ribosome quality control (RQC) complex YloA/Tae2 family protein
MLKQSWGIFFILTVMIKNYFYLNRFVIEAGKILPGKKVYNIFTQEKDKLIMEFGEEDSVNFLEMYVNPGQPHINIRTSYSRAKKNTIDVFYEVRGQIISSIKIADNDRIIKIEFDNAAIFFTIRGKYTNVLFVKEDNTVLSFKKLDENLLKDLAQELQNKNYIASFNHLNVKLDSEDYYFDIKKWCPIIGNEIIKEAKRRGKSDKKNKSLIFEKVLNEIINEQPAVFIDDNSGEIHLAPASFDVFEHTEKKIFNNLIEAQTFFLSKKRFISEKQRLLKLITKQLERELKKTANKLNKLNTVVQRESKEEEYNRLGNVLLVNISKIKTGMDFIEVENIYGSNEIIKIKLNPKLPPKKNIDYYFDKSKSEKIGIEKSKELLIQTKTKFNELKATEEILKSTDDLKELKGIMKKMKIKDKDDVESRDDIKLKLKHYLIDDKYNVYVGKDSKNNDLLTTRFAKQNDFWFHARSVSGSHIVLRVDNTKEIIPKNILKKVAALAAYHSKAKTAGTVPVAYTLKKYVIKKKGYPIGTVHLLKEDVLLVKPEIPKGCEFVVDD